MHTNPSNRFSAGSLVQANSASGVAIFTGYDLGPGEVRTCRVRIANPGSLAASFRLAEIDATNDFDRGELKLTIHEVGDRSSVTVYRGGMGEVSPEGIDLGRFEAGEERAYYFTVGLRHGALNSGQSRGAGAAFEWQVIPDATAESRR